MSSGRGHIKEGILVPKMENGFKKLKKIPNCETIVYQLIQLSRLLTIEQHKIWFSKSIVNHNIPVGKI